jgi:hypothetical protein
MTTVRYIGAYPVPVSESERNAARSCHQNDEYVSRELGSLALVELEIIAAPEVFDIGDFKQPHTNYVPYDETYYDPVSLEKLSDEPFYSPKVRDFRVAFFLHFFDPAEPLISPFGDLQVADLVERPPHLAEKEYVYWE